MRLVTSFLAAAMLMAPSVTCALVAAEPATSAPKIAVLRLEEVLNQSRPWQEAQVVWKQAKADIEKQLGEMEEAIKQREGQLQILKPESEQYPRIQEEVETLKLRRKMKIDRFRADLDRKRLVVVRTSFTGLMEKLKQFCQEKGVKIVHLQPSMELNAPNAADVLMELATKSVLYADPETDITEAFLRYLGNSPVRNGDAAPAEVVPPLAAPAPAPAGAAGK
jgi:Skp family chaperone for outer membrane proteins